MKLEENIIMDGFAQVSENDRLWTECFNWKRESLVVARVHLESRIYKNFNLMAENFKLNKDKVHKRLEILGGTFRNFKDLEVVVINGFEIDSLDYKTFKSLPSLRLLNLRQNSIRKVATSAFVDLPNLETLNLNQNRLQAIPSLYKMNKLKSLDLTENMFMRINRQSFFGVKNLEYLKLSCNFIEKVDSVTFSDLKGLKELTLCHNRISKVHRGAFSELTQLQYLTLQHNLLERLDDSTFVKLANLVKLDLSENHLTTISPTMFKSTVNLEYLNLADNKIQQVDLMAFSQLSKLKILNLCTNKIAIIAPLHFANLSLLEELRMGDNCFETLEPNIFCGLKNLTKLDLSMNGLRKIDDNLFKNQTKLVCLDICGNYIESLSDSVFVTLKCLVNLNLRKNKIKVIEKYSFKELEKLEILDLCNNLIESLDVKLFASLKSCKTLKLYYNKLRSVSKEVFQGMNALEELDLSANLLESVDSSLFTYLKGIKLLYLRQNQIKSIGEMAFQSIKDIIEIDLSHNFIQYLPEYIFANLPCLERVKLNNNLLRSLCENRFVNLPSLKLLTLHYNFIETLHDYTFKRLGSEHPISLYFSLNTFVNFNITWFEDLNQASHISHSGDTSIYDSNMMYRELFNVVSVIESRDDKLKKQWVEKRRKSPTEKIIELNQVTTCNHLIYILLQSNDFQSTLVKLRTMRLFDILIQDSNVSSQFILSILLLLKENRGLYNAELYDPDFAISNDSFKILCKNGEHELLHIFLVVTTWTESVDFKEYLIYLNIALLNDHEKVALCIFNHLKSRNFEFYELLRKFFLQKFVEIHAKYAKNYYNPSSSSSFTEFVSNLTSAMSSSSVLSRAFSSDGITNLGVMFRNKWFTFISKTLSMCKQGKNYYFKCLEYNEIQSIEDLAGEFFGPHANKSNKVQDSGKKLIERAWSNHTETFEDDEEEMLTRSTQKVKNQCKRHHLLGYIARSNNLTLLTHPTTLMLLDLKWRVFPRTYYYFNLLIYMIFLILFSVYSDEFGSDYKRSVFYWLPVLVIINYFLLIAILTALYIVMQRGFLALLQEIKVMINITALTISQVAIFMPFETPDQLNVRSGLYAMGLFISYIDFSTRLDKVPYIGPYVEVVINVAMKFSRFIPLYITICMGTLLAFRVRSSFNKVDENDPNMINYFNTSFAFSVAQLISLNIGGPVASDSMGLGSSISSANMVNYFLYLLFSFIICIFLFNIFIGIGVDQIGEIINNSNVQNLKIKVDYVLEIEDFLSTLMKRVSSVLTMPVLRQFFFVYRILQWIMSLIVCSEYEPDNNQKGLERRQRCQFLSMMLNYYEQMNMFNNLYDEATDPMEEYRENTNSETIEEITKLSNSIINLQKNLLLVRNSTQFNKNFDQVINYIKFTKDREDSSPNPVKK